MARGGPPKRMKIYASGGSLLAARDGRDRFRSGDVETVREFDPERACESMSESCSPVRKGNSS